MTVPPDPPGALPITLVTAVLLPDLTWHPVAPGGLFIHYDAVFTDPVTGNQVTTGGTPWVQAADSQTGVTYGFPFQPDRFCCQWAPPPPPPPVPAVTAVSPDTGPEGTMVTVTGTGLAGATAVMFGDLPATSFTLGGDTSLTAAAPAVTPGTTVDIAVTGPGGTSAAVPADQYTGQ